MRMIAKDIGSVWGKVGFLQGALRIRPGKERDIHTASHLDDAVEMIRKTRGFNDAISRQICST
jgi:hypothetical protein